MARATAYLTVVSMFLSLFVGAQRPLREEASQSSGLPSSCLPLVELQLECLDVSLGRPMYPERMTALLATDEGTLPEPVRQHSFSHLQAKVGDYLSVCAPG